MIRRKLRVLSEKFEQQLKSHDINYGGKGEFQLPSDHTAAMVLTDGTFSCANCKFVDEETHSCSNKYYIKWNGGNSKLPDAPLDKICSDWFEPK